MFAKTWGWLENLVFATDVARLNALLHTLFSWKGKSTLPTTAMRTSWGMRPRERKWTRAWFALECVRRISSSGNSRRKSSSVLACVSMSLIYKTRQNLWPNLRHNVSVRSCIYTSQTHTPHLINELYRVRNPILQHVYWFVVFHKIAISCANGVFTIT